MDKLAVSVMEAARLLGISRPLAFRAVHEGIIPAIRFGKRRLIVPVKALEAILEQKANLDEVNAK